jgi:zinc-ribbon domain
MHPIKKIIEASPSEAPVPAWSTVPAAPASGDPMFCTRCGNKVSADSAFCNKCGSPIIIPAVISRQTAAPVSQTAPAPRSPAEPVRTQPADVPHPPSPAPAPRQAARKPEKKGFFAGIFSPRKRAVPPAKAPASPPAQKRRRGSLVPGKKAVITGIVVLVVIVALVVGALFVYPMLTRGTPAGSSETTGSTGSSASSPSGSTGSSGTASAVLSNTGVASITVKETPSVTIPQTGVQVHISYIAGWTGSYGMPSDLQQITNSGERVYEVLNATGTIQASFTKQDTSKHTLTVEIYKNGQLLASGNTSDASGKVTVSANVGAAASAAPSTTTPVNAGNAPAATKNAVVTAVKTTAPAASTTF